MSSRMKDLEGKDVLSLFPEKAAMCSVGEKRGGLHLGYEGWGSPDIILDPALPLDLCVERLGLAGRFPLVVSDRFMNVVHGDCWMHHSAKGLADLTAPGGVLRVSALATGDLAEKALEALRRKDYAACQLFEKFVFQPHEGSCRTVYQQTFMSLSRLAVAFPMNASVRQGCSDTDPPLTPDEVRLRNVTDEAWERGASNNGMTDCLDYDWPSCIVTGCPRLATKMDANRSRYSRYCKDCYQDARDRCDDYIREAFTLRVEFRKPA